MSTVPSTDGRPAARVDARPSATASPARSILLLVAAIAVGAVALTVVSLAARAAGAPASFAPLSATAYLPSLVVGVLVGYAGWRLVRRLSGGSARVMRIVVPIVVALSLTPDVLLLLTGFIPGSTPTAVVGLMVMHPVVAAVAVPVYQRIAPVR